MQSGYAPIPAFRRFVTGEQENRCNESDLASHRECIIPRGRLGYFLVVISQTLTKTGDPTGRRKCKPKETCSCISIGYSSVGLQLGIDELGRLQASRLGKGDW